ncbi:MAG TPA: metal-dependent transcriptional regulator [Clostridia bacterium]|nr:metal-dependent transcriptional regulator [Clostridia bacterium]
MMDRLTRAQENYVRAVQYLAKEDSGVRLTDIAALMRITKASTFNAVTKLEQNGFLYRDSNRLIYLTPKGEQEASRVAENFTVIHLFLTRKLNVHENTALLDAGKLEHVVSAETVDALRSFLEKSVTASAT